jgi:hypothetical protein
MMSPAAQMLRGRLSLGTCRHSNDLATNPRIPGAISIATQPGKFPAAILGVISQQLANGIAREVAAQPDTLHLVLDTTYGHWPPI